jgi:peptidylprolyl isomerase
MRRLAVLPAVLCLSVVGLTACGKEAPVSEGSVKISGEFGSAPKITYADTPVKRETSQYKTITAGEGAKVKEGDLVNVNFYLGNGFNGTKAESTFDKGGKPAQLTVSKAQLAVPALYTAIVDHKVGSRISVIAAPKDGLASQGGNADLNIGNQDTLVLVIDIVSVVPTKPSGATVKPAAGAPKLVETAGVPTGFDFKGMTPVGKKPTVYTLIKGDGPVVKKGQNASVHYLGQVVRGNIFDASYPKGAPISVSVGAGGVIKAWDMALSGGVTVGSRIILVVPSAYGYGKTGSGDKIKPGDDLVFVMDVLAAN